MEQEEFIYSHDPKDWVIQQSETGWYMVLYAGMLFGLFEEYEKAIWRAEELIHGCEVADAQDAKEKADAN